MSVPMLGQAVSPASPDFYQACSQSVNGILRRSGGNIMLAAMGQATGSN